MDEVKGIQAPEKTVRLRTGRSFEEWATLLDDAGAVVWTHTAMARWLADQHGMDGWWCQHVVVAYEQSRGLRQPGQRADGSFSATVSRTFDGTVAEIAARVVPAVAKQIGLQPVTLNPDSKHPSGRWQLHDGTTLVIGLSPRSDGRSVVALELTRLPDADAIPEAKARLRELQAGLSSSRASG